MEDRAAADDCWEGTACNSVWARGAAEELLDVRAA